MHITTIARLYNKPADAYRGVIKKAQEDEDLVVRVYEPLRKAVVAETRESGKGEPMLLRLLPNLDNMKNAEKLKRNNTVAFARYRQEFLPKWPGFVEHYLDTFEKLKPVAVGNFPFSGRFHFSARNPKGELEYVYVSASDLDEDAISSLKELLAIIGEDRHECQRKQVVLLDLHTGTIHRPNANFTMMRRKLESILQIGSLIEKEYSRS